jgi:cell division protein FtsI (penicillin-binding protein 3)
MNYAYANRVQPELQLKLQGWRSRFMLIALATGFAILAGRAFYLQGLDNSFLQAKGEARFTRVIEMPAGRGPVMDRNGVPLAISTPVESIWASPSEIEITPDQVAALAHALNVERKDIADKLKDEAKNFVWFKRQISPEQAARVMALRIPGLFEQREYRRYYPQGEVMAHVIGFTGFDDNGQEGIELAQQAWLAGSPGSRRVIKDRKGHIIEDFENLKAPREGKGLTLSIDQRLQYLAHRELKAAVEANKAKGGAAVLLDARTGEVLALVNQPDYNPNNRASMTGRQTRNRSVTDVFEPGSTFKPFTVAAALEAGVVTPQTVFQTGNSYTIAGATISDSHPHGSLTVAEIIQKSSNIGTAKIAMQMPSEKLWSLYSELGFGATPKTGFPGEATGKLRAWKNWRPIEKATMAYGYGLNVSLLQLARAYTLFTNDGQLLPVTFIKRENDVIGKQIVSPKTARTMSGMLEAVMLPGGTATKGQVPGYRMAGKTGTARKLVNGQYVEDAHTAVFAGFGPVSDPRFIIAVSIDEPTAGKYYGGDVAAPVFANIMTGALRQFSIPPDAQLREASTTPAAVTNRSSGPNNGSQGRG